MSITSMHDGRVVLHKNDCRDVLRGIADNSIDSVVTDPPYALVSIQKRFGKPGSAPAKDVYGRGAAGFKAIATLKLKHFGAVAKAISEALSHHFDEDDEGNEEAAQKAA